MGFVLIVDSAHSMFTVVEFPFRWLGNTRAISNILAFLGISAQNLCRRHKISLQIKFITEIPNVRCGQVRPSLSISLLQFHYFCNKLIALDRWILPVRSHGRLIKSPAYLARNEFKFFLNIIIDSVFIFSIKWLVSYLK